MLNKISNRQFLPDLLIVTVIVAILHLLALRLYLYWTVDWFDILMHFIGGLNMALLAAFIFFTSGYIKQTHLLRYNKTIVFLILMMFTLVIGLGWELWEVFFGLSDAYKDRLDSVVDVIMDSIGALAGIYYVNKKIK